MKQTFLMFLLAGVFCHTAWEQDYGEPAQQPVQNLPAHDWTVTSSVNYSTGDFGTNTTTRTVYVPFTLQRNFTQGRVYATLPYISQKSGPGVRGFNGLPFRTGQTGTGNGWESGVGDIILGGSYDLLREPEKPFDLSAFGSIKFPTADDGKGLGTGEFDETLGLAASKSLDKNWSILGRLGYTFIGDPPGINFKNQFFYAAGVGYQWTDATFSSIVYEERTRLVNGQPNPRDLVLGVDHKLSETLGIFANLGFGLSNSSPDTFATAGVNAWF